MNKTDYLTGRHLLVQSQNGYTRTMGEICSNLTINIEEWSHWHRSGVFVVNFEYVSDIVLLWPLLTLNK